MFPFIKYLKYFILFSFAMLSRNQWWSNFLSLMYHALLLSCPKDSVQFSSVSQSCPTLCDPMNRSTPGLPVHHQLPELTQTHVHRVSEAIQPSHPLSSPSPPGPNPSQHQSFPSITKKKKKKTGGGDGISAELFQIQKDAAVKVLHSICHQICKT